jgi:hypothetical protein
MSHNERFDSFMFANPNFKSLSMRMFFMWDGNPKLQTWLPYINRLHDDEPFLHISVNSIVFDTFHGLIELLTAMTSMLTNILFFPILS